MKRYGLHPRVIKLAMRDEPFIVVSCREPYFAQVYDMIETQERLQGTWSEEDDVAKAAALVIAKEKGVDATRNQHKA